MREWERAKSRWRTGARRTSQYYIWANPDKCEYIDDDPFEGIGFTLGCSAAVGQQMTDAACTMIAGPWRGDTVIYVGDYWTEGSFDDERSHRLFAKFYGYPYEDILKRFENVTGRFEEARGHRYGDYLHFEERGDVFDEPYTGPFDLRVRSWRYGVNRTRREFVDRRQGPISNVYRRYVRYEFTRIDPTVLLYAMGTVDEEWGGRWCGDLVDLSDDAPGEDYRNVTEEASESLLLGPTIMADDDTVEQGLAGDEFHAALSARGSGDQPEDGRSIPGALEVLAWLLGEGPAGLR